MFQRSPSSRGDSGGDESRKSNFPPFSTDFPPASTKSFALLAPRSSFPARSKKQVSRQSLQSCTTLTRSEKVFAHEDSQGGAPSFDVQLSSLRGRSSSPRRHRDGVFTAWSDAKMGGSPMPVRGCPLMLPHARHWLVRGTGRCKERSSRLHRRRLEPAAARCDSRPMSPQWSSLLGCRHLLWAVLALGFGPRPSLLRATQFPF
jgi:hypothetical protein